MKTIILTIPDENGGSSLHVMLHYVLQTSVSPDLLSVSDTIPLDIELYGEKDGVYFDYYLTNLSSAPTIEWISSFGIKPYEGNPDQVS